ncbi:MAG: hypothetical protein AB1724_04025 [Thermodesulfobacteriota bacterium]
MSRHLTGQKKTVSHAGVFCAAWSIFSGEYDIVGSALPVVAGQRHYYVQQATTACII